MTAAARVTVAICTRNRAELFERCLLASLRAITKDVPVVVVDQSDDDRTRRLVEQIDNVVYLRSRRGLSVGRNTAVAAVHTPIVAFTDDDVTLATTWPEAIAQAFDAEPATGAVCGRATDPGGRLLPGAAAGTYRWPLNPFGLGSGFNLAFRVAALRDAGPFDEHLGAGAPIPAGEDTDMLYRVAKAGWTVACVDGIEVVHHDWRGGAELARLHYGYGRGAGAQTAKHARLGDFVAGRIALHEAARHLRTIGQAARRRDTAQISRQCAFLAGMVAGFTRRLLLPPARAAIARSEPRRSG